MTAPIAFVRRFRAMRPIQQDAIVAACLTAGLILESGLQVNRSPRPALTILLVAIVGASLVWRRRAPAAATTVSLIAVGLFVRLGEVPDWTLPLLVVAFEFFTLGGADYGRWRLLATTVTLLAGLAVVLTIDPQDHSLGFLPQVANVTLFGLLPLAVGRALRNRHLLAGQLRERSAQLERERDERMQRASADERMRIARELHDVVAHNMSVMVIQAQAAQRVAAVDPASAREALAAIESSGREALREMRGMIGVMRSADAELGSSSPSLAQLPALAERAKAAGLPVELRVDPSIPPLPLGLGLAAFRFVQEGLTNAIKHAGHASATVTASCADGILELEVCDDGRGAATANTTGAGHGLIGMRERLALYGGRLEAGRRPEGGFRLHASLPLDGAARSPEPAPAEPRAPRRRPHVPTGPRLEALLVLAVTAICAVNLVMPDHRHGSVALNLLIAVLLGACVLLRRRSAVLYAAATIGLAAISTAALTDVRVLPMSIYLLVAPAYALASYESLARGLVGLVILIIGVAIVDLVGPRSVAAGDFVFPIAVIVGSWAVARALRSGRLLGVELERGNRRLAREREHRARLAIADERTRIARELHVVVANSVSDVVVEAELAQRLLDDDPGAAAQALSVIESTARAALTEMRRILGVLRGGDDAELEPQPGLGGLSALAEQAQRAGRSVELSVDGEPGPLPMSVELAVYRIVEEAVAMTSGAAGGGGSLHVSFEFREHDLQLAITESGARPVPATVAIRERVARCGGELSEGPDADGGWELRITLPTEYAAVFA